MNKERFSMIHLETDIEGKQMIFGQAEKLLKEFGLSLSGGWEYHSGLFDGIMHREGGETIYMRLPFTVIEGELDRRDAFIEFEKTLDMIYLFNLCIDTE